jgi:hypothetical protein
MLVEGPKIAVPNWYTNPRLIDLCTIISEMWYTNLWRDNNHTMLFFLNVTIQRPLSSLPRFLTPLRFVPSLLRSHHALAFLNGSGELTAITSSHTPCYRLLSRGQPGLMTPLPSQYAKSPAFRYRLRATCGGRGPSEAGHPASPPYQAQSPGPHHQCLLSATVRLRERIPPGEIMERRAGNLGTITALVGLWRFYGGFK